MVEEKERQRNRSQGDSGTPTVSNRGTQHETITLLTGAEVSPGQVIATMGELEYLASLGDQGQALLWDVQALAQVDGLNEVSRGSLHLLKKHGLVGSDGVLLASVRAVALSAIVEARGDDGLPILRLQTPYPESDKNDEVMRQFTSFMTRSLGLDAATSQPHEQDTSRGRRGR